MLKVGDQIPLDTKVLDADENAITLQSLLTSEYLVIYFYPGDDTPTCTEEACSIRDSFSEIKNEGARLVGISPDSVKSHGKFKAKYDLPFELLSDPDHSLQDAFGVWAPKKLFGKEFFGTIRTTFIVDQTGKIVYVFGKVKAKVHGDDILKVIRELKSP